MPKTKTQGVIFGLIMSYAMAIGMEVYNIAIKEGVMLSPGGLSNMTNAVFPAALSTVFGKRGKSFSGKVFAPQTTSSFPAEFSPPSQARPDDTP